MAALDLERIWRAILPARVWFSAGGEPPVSLLSPAERDSLKAAGALRLREFAAGRWHAKRALASLGLGDFDLPRGADGAPAWPDGVVGSLAHAWHGDSISVIAVVARSDQIPAIGVDLESPARIEPRSWPTLLSSAQLGKVMTLPVAQRGDHVRALWCAKEACTKVGSEPGGIHLDASGRFDIGGHVGRVVHESGWTFAVAIRVGSEPK